jgi:hypothetical protein
MRGLEDDFSRSGPERGFMCHGLHARSSRGTRGRDRHLAGRNGIVGLRGGGNLECGNKHPFWQLWFGHGLGWWGVSTCSLSLASVSTGSAMLRSCAAKAREGVDATHGCVMLSAKVSAEGYSGFEPVLSYKHERRRDRSGSGKERRGWGMEDDIG